MALLILLPSRWLEFSQISTFKEVAGMVCRKTWAETTKKPKWKELYKIEGNLLGEKSSLVSLFHETLSASDSAPNSTHLHGFRVSDRASFGIYLRKRLRLLYTRILDFLKRSFGARIVGDEMASFCWRQPFPHFVGSGAFHFNASQQDWRTELRTVQRTEWRTENRGQCGGWSES